jgi:hypothetical protein
MEFRHLPLKSIEPNEDNPRGINIQVDDPKLAYLKDSIKQFGVIVPVVVSKRPDGKYLLIDGERRYWAAKSLGLSNIPSYIIDPNGAMDKNDILFRMFQIHHNREPWGPVQQCHALEAVFQDIAGRAMIKSIRDHKAKIKAIAEELVKITGIEERTAIDRVHFLLWPGTIKDRLYNNPHDEGYWYICEIEEKIIIPAVANYPEYFRKVPVDEVRIDLFRKLEQHSVDKSTDVRRVAPFLRVNLNKESDRKVVMRILAELHRRADMTYSDAQDELLKHFPNFHKGRPISDRKLQNMLTALEIAIDDFDFGGLSQRKRQSNASINELITAVQSLMESLQSLRKNLEALLK